MAVTTLRLRPGGTAVVGYGLLLDRSTVERTVGAAVRPPFVMASLAGWRRVWGVAQPNDGRWFEGPSGPLRPASILYLDVRPDATSTLNCSVFELDPDQLAAVDAREVVYEREIVTPGLVGVSVFGGEAMLYRGLVERVMAPPRSPDVAVIPAEFVRRLQSAVRSLGEDDRRRFEASTDPVPRHLVLEERPPPR